MRILLKVFLNFNFAEEFQKNARKTSEYKYVYLLNEAVFLNISSNVYFLYFLL